MIIKSFDLKAIVVLFSLHFIHVAHTHSMCHSLLICAWTHANELMAYDAGVWISECVLALCALHTHRYNSSNIFSKEKKKIVIFIIFPFYFFTFYSLIRDNSNLFTSGETVINMYPQPQSHISLIDWHLAQYIVHNQSITIEIPKITLWGPNPLMWIQ